MGTNVPYHFRGASPLGLPYTRSRAPLRRRASASARSATARPRRSLGVGGPIAWPREPHSARVGSLARSFARCPVRPHPCLSRRIPVVDYDNERR